MKILSVKYILIFCLIVLLAQSVNAKRRRGKNGRKKINNGAKVLGGAAIVKSKSSKKASKQNKPISNQQNATEATEAQKNHTIALELCNMNMIKSKIIQVVKTQQLPASEVILIWSGNTSLKKKLELVNKALNQHRLPLIPPCLPPVYNVATSLPKDPQKFDSSPNSGFSHPNDRNFQCDPEDVIFKLQKVSFLDQLQFDKILSVLQKNQTRREKINLLNEILKEENLVISPVSSSRKKRAAEKRPPNCGKYANNSKIENIALVRQLEKEGLVPPNSLTKTMFGWMSKEKLKNLTLIGLVKSGRLDAVCLNRTKEGTTMAETSTNIVKTRATINSLAPKSTTQTTTPSNSKPKTQKTTGAASAYKANLQKVTIAAIHTSTLPTATSRTNKGGKLKSLPDYEAQIISERPAAKTKPSAPASVDDCEFLELTTLAQSDIQTTTLVQFIQTTTASSKPKKVKVAASNRLSREEIMPLLPDPLRKLIEDGKMPSYIEEAIFSGNYTQTELAQMILSNDDVIKAMLPVGVQNMLQDRPVPTELKVILLSGKNATEIREEIQGNDELMQELMTPSTYFFYKLFTDQKNKDMNVAISVMITVGLIAAMTSLGCTMTITEIGKHVRKPKGVVIALIAQFVMMPAASFGLTQAFKLDTFAAIAVLICGCCPGGNLSNIISYALRGDMNLSILMTTCSSIFGLGLMPLNIYIYSQFIVPVETGVVPFGKIVINIALTIIPVGIGILIRHFKPEWKLKVMRIGAVILLLSMITVAVMSGILYGTSFFVYFPTSVVACCAILPIAGYLFGFFFAWIAREKPKCMRTICVETGCQNVQLCSTVLKLAFDPILVGVLFLMPLIYMCFQIAEAALMILSFRIFNILKSRNKMNSETSDESDDKNYSDVDTFDHKMKQLEEESKNLLDENEKKHFDSDKVEKDATFANGKSKTFHIEGSKNADNETVV